MAKRREKRRSLTNQLVHAVAESRAHGESKRSYKMGHNNSTDNKIFGDKYYLDLQKEAKQLGEWIKDTHPEIRWAKEINAEILQEYLNKKAADGVKLVTLRKKLTHLKKIETCTKKAYAGATWNTELLALPDVVEEQRVKVKTMSATDTDYEKILAELRKGKSNAWRALVLSRYANLRIGETANVKIGRLQTHGGKYGCGTLTICGKQDGAKGGRWRTVDILTPEARDALKMACTDCGPGNCIVQKKDGQPLSVDGIRRAYSRAIVKAGLDPEEWKWNVGGHPFRKAYSQELWNVCRASGGTREDAKRLVNMELGHGENRRDLVDRYVKNQW